MTIFFYTHVLCRERTPASTGRRRARRCDTGDRRVCTMPCHAKHPSLRAGGQHPLCANQLVYYTGKERKEKKKGRSYTTTTVAQIRVRSYRHQSVGNEIDGRHGASRLDRRPNAPMFIRQQHRGHTDKTFRPWKLFLFPRVLP